MSRIPNAIRREDVLAAVQALKQGAAHDFGPSTRYDVVIEGGLYPPKAVVALAAIRLGVQLDSEDFRSGEGTRCFALLQSLGFEIRPKLDQARTGEDWAEEEIRILVADYFGMLQKDMLKVPYSKAEHNRRMQELLPGRSRGSIEYKYQNISGVLYDEKYPFLDGYKPALNYQRRLLPEIVLDYVDSQPSEVAEVERAAELVRPAQPRADFTDCKVDAPEYQLASEEGKRRPHVKRGGHKRDFAARDAANRALGLGGEQFVVDFERWRLRVAGCGDLAERVRWAAQVDGDGLGYDVLSFELQTGEPRYIEVKTTNCNRDFPFYLTRGEVDASVVLGERYYLYRLFNFSTITRFYSVQGDLRAAFNLAPRLYEASRR